MGLSCNLSEKTEVNSLAKIFLIFSVERFFGSDSFSARCESHDLLEGFVTFFLHNEACFRRATSSSPTFFLFRLICVTTGSFKESAVLALHAEELFFEILVHVSNQQSLLNLKNLREHSFLKHFFQSL